MRLHFAAIGGLMNGSGNEMGNATAVGNITTVRNATPGATATPGGTASAMGSVPGPGNVEARLAGGRDQVVQARRLVSATLGRDHPLHDDCVLLTSEIATNAVVHSRSGDGGEFTVTVTFPRGRVRVCVQDEGSASPPCAGHSIPNGSSGRGLPLLDALSARWGMVREAGRNKVWFEIASV